MLMTILCWWGILLLARGLYLLRQVDMEWKAEFYSLKTAYCFELCAQNPELMALYELIRLKAWGVGISGQTLLM